jgi:hypothetical protein
VASCDRTCWGCVDVNGTAASAHKPLGPLTAADVERGVRHSARGLSPHPRSAVESRTRSDPDTLAARMRARWATLWTAGGRRLAPSRFSRLEATASSHAPWDVSVDVQAGPTSVATPAADTVATTVSTAASALRPLCGRVVPSAQRSAHASRRISASAFACLRHSATATRECCFARRAAELRQSVAAPQHGPRCCGSDDPLGVSATAQALALGRCPSSRPQHGPAVCAGACGSGRRQRGAARGAANAHGGIRVVRAAASRRGGRTPPRTGPLKCRHAGPRTVYGWPEWTRS